MLRPDHALRCKQMLRAVDMRLKNDAFLRNLVEISEAPDLKSAAICQNRTIPSHKAVKTARFSDEFGSRTQIEVIRIPQDNPHIERFQIFLAERLDCRLSAHGHKNRCLDLAVRRVEDSSACTRFRILCDQFISERRVDSKTSGTCCFRIS